MAGMTRRKMVKNFIFGLGCGFGFWFFGWGKGRNVVFREGKR